MPQNVAGFLDEALGRNGSNALPYASEFRFLVQQHLTDLVSVRAGSGTRARRAFVDALTCLDSEPNGVDGPTGAA